VVFIVAYNFQVMMPLLAFRVLGGSSELFGVVMSSLGLGAVCGSLLIASWVRPGTMMVAVWCGMIGAAYVFLALPFGVYFSVAAVFLLGVCSGFFNVTVTATLQVRARDDLRGRITSLYGIGILGSALIGAPLAGLSADRVGVTATFLIIAALCACVGALTMLWSRRGITTVN
jgi:predicted MFS family arabinose efflux permease